MTSVAGALAAGQSKARWRLLWDSAKTALVSLSFVLGAAFALEQYLASQYEANKARVEASLSAASAALGTSDRVLQANAVRTLPRLGEFSTYSVQPGGRSLGRHLRAALLGLPMEFPYFEQSWLLLRDVAASRRTLIDQIVSSSLLSEGAAWEHRIRRGHGVPRDWNRGSLLFQAQLAGAKGNNLDLHGIQFGAADLTGADLSGSDCADCGMLGAHLDDTMLRGATFQSAFMAEASMDGADFSFAKLPRAVLRKAHADHATFLQADLTGADCTAAHLDGSTFSQAVLAGANFSRASLRRVQFPQSDVSAAKFDDADVEGADFTNAVGFSEQLLTAARGVKGALLPPRADSTAPHVNAKETRQE